MMHSTRRPTNTALGTVAPAQVALRRGHVFIIGASSFPYAQKVPTMVTTLTGELRKRMPGGTTLREQMELPFKAHQRLFSTHPFNDENRRTSKLLTHYV